MLVYYQHTLIKSMKVITEFSLQISEKNIMEKNVILL